MSENFTYILRITGNYADEFDVMGVHEISDHVAEFLIETNGVCFTSPEEIYFGSNESVNLCDLSVTVDIVTDLEMPAVKRALGIKPEHRLSYGLIDLEDIIEEAYELAKTTDS